MIKKYLEISKSLQLALPTHLIKQIYIIYFCLIFAALLEMIGLGSIPFFISILLDTNSSFEIWNINLTERVKSMFKEENFLIFFPLIIILIFLIKNLVLFIIAFLETSIIRNIKIFFIQRLFKIYLFKPYDFYLKKNSAEIIKNIFNETQFTTSMVANLLTFIRELTILFVVGILILSYEPIISLSAILILVIFFLIFYKIFNNYIINLGKLRLKFLDYVFNNIQSLSGAIKDIKIYKKEKFFNDRFTIDVTKYENVIFKQNFIEKMPRIIFEVLAVAVVFSIVSVYFYLGGDIDSLIPILALFAVSLIRLIPAFKAMSTATLYMNNIKISFDYITNQIIEFNQNKHSNEGLVRNFYVLKDKIASIKDLNFNYSIDKNAKTIKDFNFNIKRGDLLGIIGKSGSGKSTLINLLLGLLKTNTGEIVFDYEEKETKNLFSYVPQEIYLLDDTLRRNIAFGEKDHDIDENDIIEAVKMSGLLPLIEKNKQGLDLVVGERGVRLSGGEKQRVGLARALYKKSKILILDEATSSLDIVTEKQIMNSINKLKNKLTIIIVTHRLSTIETCDRVFLIKDGKLLDEGTLVSLKNKYPSEFLK